MTGLEVKTLEQIERELKAYDTYPAYKFLTDALDQLNVENATKSSILGTYQELVHKNQTKKVEEAKEWVKTLIQDNKK